MKNFNGLLKAADVWFNADQKNMLYEFMQAYYSAQREIEQLKNERVVYAQITEEKIKQLEFNVQRLEIDNLRLKNASQ